MKIAIKLFTGFCMILFASSVLHAQETDLKTRPWTFKTLLLMSGSSDKSDPAGYIVYSAFTVEPSICRQFSQLISAELSVRTESHEVDNSGENANEKVPLGSIELLPANLFVQFNLLCKGKVHAYAGAGLNATFCWEKSGQLNSTDLTPGIGPAIQIGSDIDISRNILFNFNAGWNALKTDIKSGNDKIATLMIDPISIGAGLGFRF